MDEVLCPLAQMTHHGYTMAPSLQSLVCSTPRGEYVYVSRKA